MIPRLVSVVIPTYNRRAAVERAVRSVLAQSYAPVEVLVVDDGSTDGTAAALAEAFGSEARVSVISGPNRGVAGARNRGLEAVRGEFVAFLDSDDTWLPWKLEAQIAVFDAFDVGMVWSDMTAVDEDGALVSERWLRKMYRTYGLIPIDRIFSVQREAPWMPESMEASVHLGDVYDAMTCGNIVHTSTVVLRAAWAKEVGGFDTSLRRSGEDFDYHLRTTALGPVALLDTPTIRYQVGGADQLTAPEFQLDLARNFIATITRAAVTSDRPTDPRRIQESLAFGYRWLGTEQREAGQRRNAIRSLWRSLKLEPSMRTLRRLIGTLLGR